MDDDVAFEHDIIDADPTPRVIGSLVAGQIIEDMQVDGWNYKGFSTPNDGICTANCRPFVDSYGYVPKNSPWEITDSIAWQPLIESNDLGLFYAQEHVTPHIGFNAKPVILDAAELAATELASPILQVLFAYTSLYINECNIPNRDKSPPPSIARKSFGMLYVTGV